MKYYLITNTEDGIHIKEGTAQEIIRTITGTDYHFFDHLPEMSQGHFLEGYIGAAPLTHAVLIRGDIIVPRVKETVTEYILQ